MEVTGQESSLKSTGGGVQDDTPGDQERSKTVIHSGQSFNGGGTTEQKHGGHDKVGAETEEQEGDVGGKTPSGLDDLSEGVGGRSDLLELDGDDSEQQDLNGGTRCVPEGS